MDDGNHRLVRAIVGSGLFDICGGYWWEAWYKKTHPKDDIDAWTERKPTL